MKKTKFIITILVILVSLLISIGCPILVDPNDDDNGGLSAILFNIIGAWGSAYGDSFTIEPSNDNYVLTYLSDYNFGFVGLIETEFDPSHDTGYIVYKVLSKDVSSDLTTDEYSVMTWKDGTSDNNGRQCNATCSPFKLGHSSTAETTQDALDEFTVENGYFDYFGTYKKE